MTFPAAGQQVTAHYALFLDDCTFIESSRDDGEAFTFIIGVGKFRNRLNEFLNLCIIQGQVIEGWERGLAQMSLGQRVSMTLSPDMAYGEAGAGDGVIPPNATLVFDIEVLKIE